MKISLQINYKLNGSFPVRTQKPISWKRVKTGRYCCLLVLMLFMCPVSFLNAQENSDCLSCHNDKSITGTKMGKTISVFVDGKKFSGSIHAKLACIDCHVDIAGKELPHEEKLAPVDCGKCHPAEQELHAKSLHGKAIARGDILAPHCKECHGTHEIYSAKDSRSPVSPLKVPFTCGKCHQEGSLFRNSALFIKIISFKIF